MKEVSREEAFVGTLCQECNSEAAVKHYRVGREAAFIISLCGECRKELSEVITKDIDCGTCVNCETPVGKEPCKDCDNYDCWKGCVENEKEK